MRGVRRKQWADCPPKAATQATWAAGSRTVQEYSGRNSSLDDCIPSEHNLYTRNFHSRHSDHLGIHSRTHSDRAS